jgi:hypothetical protein
MIDHIAQAGRLFIVEARFALHRWHGAYVSFTGALICAIVLGGLGLGRALNFLNQGKRRLDRE